MTGGGSEKLGSPNLFLVYGLTQNPETVRQALLRGDEEVRTLSNRYALIGPDTPPFRLSSGGWVDIPPEAAASIPSMEDVFRSCRERILHQISPFAKPARLFLDRYFDFVDHQVTVHADCLGPQMEDGDIFTARDWLFSAWLPLPQVRLLLDEGGGDGVTPTYAEIDVVFWLGSRLLGIVVEGSGMLSKSRLRRLDRLQEAYPAVSILRLPQVRLGQGGADFPTDLFPDGFAEYWGGLSLPQGPYRQDVLDWEF